MIHAIIFYGLTDITKNSFGAKFACMDGYQITTASGFTVNIYWAY